MPNQFERVLTSSTLVVRTEKRCRRCFLKVIYIPPLLRGGRWVVVVVWCYNGSGGGRHRIELIKKKEKKAY